MNGIPAFILGIDCAHEACSVAVGAADGRIMAAETLEMERGQAEALMPMVQRVMKAAGIEYDRLASVAVSVGPGSFTGVRVGLAAAGGIALAANLPMAGVSVMEAVAAETALKHPQTRDFWVVLETKRDDYYAQHFEGVQALCEPAVMSAENLKQAAKGSVCAGNGTARLAVEAPGLDFLDIRMPGAETVVRLAALKTPEKRMPAPLYLREAEVTVCSK